MKVVFKKRNKDGYSCSGCFSEDVPTIKLEHRFLCVFCYETGEPEVNRPLTEIKMHNILNSFLGQLKSSPAPGIKKGKYEENSNGD